MNVAPQSLMSSLCSRLLDKVRFWHYHFSPLKQVQYSGEWTFSVDKSFILNPDINIEAKAVYLALKSFCAPGISTAFPSIDTLQKSLKLSRGRLYKYLKELNALDLLVREQSTSSKGTFGHTLYTLYSTQKPVGEKPAHGLPHAKRYQGEKKVVKERNTKERKSAEEIYSFYPRKVGRPLAIRAILKALKGWEPDFLLGRTKVFATARKGEDPKFTPHPATWFNQERFRDDPSTWGNGKGEAHAEGDPAGELQGKPVRWTKIGSKWIRAAA